MSAAAKKLHDRFGCAFLIKGGHLRGIKEAVDIFYDGKQELMLSAPFIRGVRTPWHRLHVLGGDNGYLARGLALPEAVQRSKEYITQAIAGSQRVGKTSSVGKHSQNILSDLFRISVIMLVKLNIMKKLKPLITAVLLSSFATAPGLPSRQTRTPNPNPTPSRPAPSPMKARRDGQAVYLHVRGPRDQTVLQGLSEGFQERPAKVH